MKCLERTVGDVVDASGKVTAQQSKTAKLAGRMTRSRLPFGDFSPGLVPSNQSWRPVMMAAFVVSRRGEDASVTLGRSLKAGHQTYF